MDELYIRPHKENVVNVEKPKPTQEIAHPVFLCYVMLRKYPYLHIEFNSVVLCCLVLDYVALCLLTLNGIGIALNGIGLELNLMLAYVGLCWVMLAYVVHNTP